MERNLTKKAERIKDKERLSTVVTNKMLVVFLALVLAIAVLVRLGNDIGFIMALPYLQIAFAVLTAAALAWYIVCLRRSVDARYSVFSAPLLLGISAAGLFAVLTHMIFGDPFRTILVMLAFALLFFVYQIFSVDFFACSLSAVVACISAALINGAGVTVGMKPFVAVLAVLASALASAGGGYFVYKLYSQKRITVLGRRYRRPQRCVPAAVYTVMGVSFVTVLASLIFGYLLYCIAAIAIVYVVAAIIYTVKLM